MSKFIRSIVFLGLLSILWSECLLIAQTSFISQNLFPARRIPQAFEIGEIRFENNITFSSEFLAELISTKATRMSWQHRIFEYYYDNVKQIGKTPQIIDTSLGIFLKNHLHEISHFNEQIANSDVETLWSYYNTNGFHFAEVSYRFIPDSARRLNVLIFDIKESDRYKIDTLVYLGLEDVDKILFPNIKSIKINRRGDYFREELILVEVENIQSLLLNNGYFYSSFRILPIAINPETLTDSITVVFNPGRRQTISSIQFVDSLKNQNIVVRPMKTAQLDFKIGDWYSLRSIQRSLNNLNSLGTFESVSIDTSSAFVPLTDSTLSILVTSIYRKQKEWSVGLFMNNTQVDNYTNVGVEASIFHRNWGGAAQSGTLYTNVRAKNISDIIAGNRAEYEGQIGLRLAQPLIWAIENMRIGGAGRIYYSYLNVEQLFNISAWFTNIRFPINLTNETYINQIIVDFNFELQNLVNYLDVQKKQNLSDTSDARIRRSFDFYRQLYHYLNEPGLKLATANILGITLIGDSRNHPFSPTSGDYFYGSVDGWNFFLAHPVLSGLARYLRLQTAYSIFAPLSVDNTFAAKLRSGVIFRFDKENSYVPFERQFFAGGANSVRGWSSRELHYSRYEPNSFAPNDSTYKNDYLLYSNLVGSRVLLEGSLEMRYRFPYIDGLNEIVADQISKLGITAFLDFGNAYHWFIEGDDDITRITFLDYFTKLAWALGIGLRYDTPIGPLRFDIALPLYRPNYSLPDYKLWSEHKALKDLRFHFSIGHPF